MAASRAANLLDDITECPICTEFYTDPRVLPCIHTYCLRCIEKWGQNKKPEEKLTCPLCRKEFEIPNGRYIDLPKNFFVEKLLEAKNLTAGLSHQDKPCDLCSDIEGQTEVKKAIMYCVDCRQNLCQTCLKFHSKANTLKSHKQLLEVEAGDSGLEEVLQKHNRDRCEKHPEESLKIYCIDCKSVTCMMCYIIDHNSHRCADVSQVVEEMRKQVNNGCKGLDENILKLKEVINKLSDIEKTFMESVAEAEKRIVEKSEEMKRMIDNYKMELLQQLALAKKEKEKQMETGRQEIERRIVMIESFKKYSEELTTKGTACDIVRAASGLVDRAEELMEFNVERDLDINRTADYVKFVSVSSTTLASEVKQLFGEVNFTANQPMSDPNDQLEETSLIARSSRPLHVVNANGQVSGVTSLGDQLFMCYWKNKQVDVYDAESMTLQRQLSLPSTGQHQGIAACDNNNCLYVSDGSNSKIYRVELADSNTVTNWSVGNQPHGLSVNTDHNVLVACYGANKIQEYTTHGKLAREVSLQSDITRPLNVVQLSSGQFGVTHGGSLHRYCVVGLDGKVVKSYGGSPGSGDGQLSGPYGLSVSKRGTVFIADYYNHRVLMLDPTTFTASQLSIHGGLKQPYCLHIDSSRDGIRLYIGECLRKRVLVMGK